MKKWTVTLALVVAAGVVTSAAQGASKKAAPTAADSQKDSVDKKFKKADANGDGFIDSAELKAEAKVMRGAKAPAEGDEAHYAKVKPLIMVADGDKDGKISHAEYVKWATAPEEALKPAPAKK